MEHEQFRIEVVNRLAKVEAGQVTLDTKIDANHKILEAKLEPLARLVTQVQEHDRDIHRWKGVNGVLAFAASIIAGAYIKGRHWF